MVMPFPPVAQSDPMSAPPMTPDAVMQPMAPDPDQVYTLMSLIRKEIEKDAAKLVKPAYPKWYKEKDYPKPDEKKVISLARRLEGEFSSYRSQVMNDLAIYRMHIAGVFRDFDKDEEEPWFDDAIMSEVELISYMLADIARSYDAPAKKRSEEDEAARKIDFTIACEEQAKRQHSRRGGGDLYLDEARMLLLTGRLCYQITLNEDCDEDEMPFRETLLDPMTVYPVFDDDRGLREAVRCYRTSLGRAVGTYSTSEKSLEYMLSNRGKDGKFQKSREENEQVEVIEYWNRRWRLVFVDGSLVVEAEHKFGFVPIVYQIGGLGAPAVMQDNRQDTGNMYLGNYTGRDAADATKGISLVRLLMKPHQLREAVMSRMLGNWQKSMDPPLLVGLDDILGPDEKPIISRRRKDTSYYKRDHHTITPMPTATDTGALAPILQGANDNVQRLTMPPSAMGANDKSNISGYAANAMNDAGRVRLIPHIRTIEEFTRQRAEMRLRLFRDWGYGITQGESIGLMNFPKDNPHPDEDRYTELDAGDLRRTGIAMTVSLSTLPMGMMGSLANAASLMMNMGVMDEIGAMKFLKMQNPEKTYQRIQTNKLINDPDLIRLKFLQALKVEAPEDAAYLEAKWNQQKQSPPLSSSPEGMPGTQLPGDSLPGMGLGPGPGSGPQGPLGPQQGMM